MLVIHYYTQGTPLNMISVLLFQAIQFYSDVELKIANHLLFEIHCKLLYTQDECSLKLSCRDLNVTTILLDTGYLSDNFCSIIDNRKQYL